MGMSRAGFARGHKGSARGLTWGIVLALLLLLPGVDPAAADAVAAALVTIPPLEGTVVDAAGVLAPGEIAQADATLRQLRQQNGAQVVVLVVDHTTPEPLEDYAQRVFTTWRLGRKGVDDGLLFLLAVNNPPPRTRIHTGYGLEGSMPDATAKRILAEHVRPALQVTGPGAAVNAAAEEISRVLAARPAAQPQAAAPADEPYGSRTYHPSEPEKRMLLGALGLIGAMLLVPLLLMLPWRPLRRALAVAACLAVSALTLWVSQGGWTAAFAVAWIVVAGWALVAEPLPAAPAPARRRMKRGAAMKSPRAAPGGGATRRSGNGMRTWIVPLASLAGIAIVATYATGMLGYAVGATGWFFGSLVITNSIRSRLSPRPQRAGRGSGNEGDTWSSSSGSDAWSSDSSDSGGSDSGGDSGGSDAGGGGDSGGGGSSD